MIRMYLCSIVVDRSRSVYGNHQRRWYPTGGLGLNMLQGEKPVQLTSFPVEPGLFHGKLDGMSMTIRCFALDRAHVVSGLLVGWFCLGSALHSADWPRWRGPGNDGHAIGAEAPGSLPTEPTTLWTERIGAGFSSPVVAGGRLAIMDNENDREVLHVRNAADGKALWKAELDDTFTDAQGPPGPRNTPVIDGDRIYAVSGRGELQCRQLADGTLLWRTSYTEDLGAVFIGERGTIPGAARHGNNGAPVIDGPHLIAPVGGTNGHSVVAFDKLKGTIVWHSQDDMAGYGAPVVADIAGVRQVIAFTVDGVIGLHRADGRLLWRVPLQTAYGRHVITPVVAGDLVIVGSHQVGLIAIKLTRINDEVQATTAWVSREAAPNFAQPVAHNGFLYTLGPKRDVLCVDLANGNIRWRETGLIITPADRAHASFVVIQDEILMLSDAGELVLFEANPNGCEIRGRVQVCGMNWCNPAYVNGVLYLRDGLRGPGNLLAIRI
jgi:outer membrane protein assembly factor BamB